MNQPTVLLIARKSEFNLHKIETSLQHRRVAYQVIAPAYDETQLDYSLGLDGADDSDVMFSRDGSRYSPDAIKAVWNRGACYAGDRPTQPNSAENRAIAETRHAFNYLWFRLGHCRWVNPLPSVERTNRLIQCRQARDAGMAVAASIVSTRGKDIRSFLDAHGDCIVKPISQGARSERGPGQILAELFPKDAVLDDRLFVPVLVQEFVAKDHELRVAVVGDRVFAAAIDSTADARSTVDSRNWIRTELTYYRVSLSPREESALIALNETLGFAYSSMDLIRSPDGTLTFLEANPSGQWTFMELQTGYPVTEAIVDLLCS